MSSLVQSILATLSQAPTTPCLLEGETAYTRQQVTQGLLGIAAWAQQQPHWLPGDRVALALGNSPAMLMALLGLRAAGLVPVPINLQWGADDTAYVLQHAGVKGLITANALQPLFQPLIDATGLPSWAAETLFQQLHTAAASGLATPPAIASTNTDDLALLIYTSGTTARPKGVMLSETNLLANMAGIAGTGLLGTTADTLLMALPLFHAYGLTLSLYALQAGVTMVLEPTFQPKALLTAMARHQVTVLPLVPSMLRVLGEALQRDDTRPALASLKWCVSGGAALPPALLDRLSAAGLPVLEGYGLTEASPVVAVNRPAEGPRPGTVGLPLPNVQIRIVPHATSENTRKDSEASLGEVEIAGPNVMLGYYRDPEATAQVITADGWLKTGDLGCINPDGTLSLTDGRIKELIIKHGENIAPQRVEAALMAYPHVADVCVFGQPDAKAGEVVVACVVAATESDLAETDLKRDLAQWAAAHLPPLYHPHTVHVLAELPKNATGKVLRRTLKDQFAPQLISSV